MSKEILTVYLAGRIDGISADRATNWRDEALKLLAKNKFAGLCPITHGVDLELNSGVPADLTKPEIHNKIFEIDLDLIFRSDAVIANMEYISFGTAQEIFYADKILNIPVIAFNNKSCTSAFLYATTYKIVDTLEDAIEVLKTLNKKSEMLTIGGLREVLWSTRETYDIPLEKLKKRNSF